VVRHSLVQKIVKAYERYNEVIGVNRQLSLRLAEPAPEAGSRDAGLAEPASPQFPVA
jgi:phosphate starvation-inducible PhoH-like protein